MVKYAVSALDMNAPDISADGNHLWLKTNSLDFDALFLMHGTEISLSNWEWMLLVREKNTSDDKYFYGEKTYKLFIIWYCQVVEEWSS